MRQVINRVFGVILATAGLLLLVAPNAHAADILCLGAAGGDGSTTFFNLTGQNCNGGADLTYTQATIQGSALVGPGATFISGPDQTVVGTGLIQPFVRIQDNGPVPHSGPCVSPCIESGYNTNASGQFDTKDTGEHNWTHAIRLSQVGLEDGYRVFYLDINESNNPADRYLSLDKFQIYLSSSPVLNDFCETAPDATNPTPPADCFNNGFNGTGTDNVPTPLVYSMDGGDSANQVDASIGLNYDLNRGSGLGYDLTVRIPDALFQDQIAAAGGGNPYVYLYSSFGATGVLDKQNKCTSYTGNGKPPIGCPAGYLPPGDYGQSAGFEEWSTLKGVPEPMSMALLLVGLAAIGFVRRQQPTPVAC